MRDYPISIFEPGSPALREYLRMRIRSRQPAARPAFAIAAMLATLITLFPV